MINRLWITVSYLVPALTAATLANRVDTHFHAVPPAYVDALEANGGDPSGYPTPEWSVDAAIKSMDSIGTQKGILSITSPGVPIAGTGQEARDLARTLNQYFENLTESSEYGTRLGFFGVLPDWQDVEGTLNEIDYLYSERKLCSGVTVFTSYGSQLLGASAFKPIWEKLQSHKALIFVHPSETDITPKFIGPGLPQPIVDYPLATTRAATDLVVSGTMANCPDIDVILSHAGGAVPYLASRVIDSLSVPAVAAGSNVNASQARQDFARFYHDIALSTSRAQLDGLLDFSEPSHILFGSDFPYAPQAGVDAIVAQYAAYVVANDRGSQISPPVLLSNALTLLAKHSL